MLAKCEQDVAMPLRGKQTEQGNAQLYRAAPRRLGR
jgi:hypothetical protein